MLLRNGRETEDLYNELKILYDAGVKQDILAAPLESREVFSTFVNEIIEIDRVKAYNTYDDMTAERNRLVTKAVRKLFKQLAL